MSGLASRVKRLQESIAARLFHPMVHKVRARGLTYLSNARLISLAKRCDELIRSRRNLLVVEFGVALGGSSILMADILKRTGCGRVLGYDMFGLIPEPSVNDGGDAHKRYAEISGGRSKGLKGQTYYGYETNLQTKVGKSFSEFGLVQGKHFELIAGDFRQSFQHPERKIDLMHIDCDWYDSVVFCLAVAKEHLSEGGYIVVDDYNDYEGCARAVDQFVSAENGMFVFLTKVPHAVIQRFVRDNRTIRRSES
jgi:O-methyltransferase